MAVVDTEKYRMIRRLYTVEGLSQRQIARQLNVSRDTVKKYCEGKAIPGERKEYTPEKAPLRLMLEEEILKIINENKDAPKKQSLNSKIIWEKLIDAGYKIGESTIRKYVQELRIDKPEIFIPIEHEPGESMEFDWGDAYAYINKVKTRVVIGQAICQ